MAFFDIPFTLGGIIGQLISILIITAVVYFADKYIAHEMSIKHSLIMGLVAYFAVPLIFSYLRLLIPFIDIILPLAVWIILGEILLKGDRMNRLKASVLAFAIYLVLGYANLPGLIATAINF